MRRGTDAGRRARAVPLGRWRWDLNPRKACSGTRLRCFRPVGSLVDQGKTIAHALLHFAHLQDESTIEALYALRNALAHDYALFSYNKDRPARSHAFNYCADTVSPLVTLPSVAWGGVY